MQAAAPGEDGGADPGAEKEREKRRLAQNREAAKRFRAKKKGYLAELEETVAFLRRENEALQARLADMSGSGQGRERGAVSDAGGGGSLTTGIVHPPAIQKVLLLFRNGTAATYSIKPWQASTLLGSLTVVKVPGNSRCFLCAFTTDD
jgi:hypothetical protein